jgi:hypothetical protein
MCGRARRQRRVTVLLANVARSMDGAAAVVAERLRET